MKGWDDVEVRKAFGNPPLLAVAFVSKKLHYNVPHFKFHLVQLDSHITLTNW